MRNLWRVGFMPRALSLATLMSGLVEILDVYWHLGDGALIFVVRSKSKVLFKQNSLKATVIKEFQPSNQSLFVDLTRLNEPREVQE